MPQLQILIKPASGLCNLRCRYCFYHDVASKRERESYGIMSLETLEALVARAFERAEGECAFSFQGGEPTLAGLPFYRELLRLQKKYNTRQVAVHNSIQTNGYGLGREWAEFLAENHFLTGLSLDGVKAVHDAFRVDGEGRGTFAEIMKTAELFHSCGVEYNILTVVNRKTAGKIRRIYEFYRKQGFSYLQFIACLDPLGETPGGRGYSLTPEDYGKFLTELFDLWYLDWEKGCQPYIRQFENYVGLLMGFWPESCEQRGECSIQYVVEADGSVYPCDFYVLDKWKLGNIRDHSFEELAESEPGKAFIREGKEKSEECGACPYGLLCRGGCRRRRESGMGKDYFCSSYRTFFERALPRLRYAAECAAREMREMQGAGKRISAADTERNKKILQ